MRDEVRVKGLRLRCKIGVPVGERADFQELELDLVMTTAAGFPKEDEIAGTVDYAAVVARVEEFVGEHIFQLIETMAQRIADLILEEFAVDWVRVELRKFILPQTQWVGVALERGKCGEFERN